MLGFSTLLLFSYEEISFLDSCLISFSDARLLGPYDPVKNFKAGEDTLVLGEIAHNEKLQAAIIESNLRADDAVISFESVEWEYRPFSNWEICIIALQDRTFLIKAIFSIALCCFGLYFWKCTALSIMDYYTKYTQGCLIQEYLLVYHRSIAMPLRPLDLYDVIAWGFELSIVNIAYDALCLFFVYRSYQALEERLGAETPKSVAIASLIKRPSSGAVLTSEVQDYFSKKLLSFSEARQPKKLTIGKYTGDIWLMIRNVLSKDSQKYHPCEDRRMTSEEAAKFDVDVRNVLAVRSLDFLWSMDSENRKKEFLNLLPQSIRKKHNLDKIFV